jgi:hypothetical protein
MNAVGVSALYTGVWREIKKKLGGMIQFNHTVIQTLDKITMRLRFSVFKVWPKKGRQKF